MAKYSELLNSFDDELKAQGYTEEQIEHGKSWARAIGPRSIRNMIENRGTVSPLFEGQDCAKALLALVCAEALA